MEEEFRENVSVVFQDFGKYYTTINENIRLGFGDEAYDTKIVQSDARRPHRGKWYFYRTCRNEWAI